MDLSLFCLSFFSYFPCGFLQHLQKKKDIQFRTIAQSLSNWLYLTLGWAKLLKGSIFLPYISLIFVIDS